MQWNNYDITKAIKSNTCDVMYITIITIYIYIYIYIQNNMMTTYSNICNNTKIK